MESICAKLLFSLENKKTSREGRVGGFGIHPASKDAAQLQPSQQG